MTERADSVSIQKALPVYLQGVKDGKTFDEIAAQLEMATPSLRTKISTARTQYLIGTRIYADGPEVNGEQPTITGVELMGRLNLNARQLKKNKDFAVITEGRKIPGTSDESVSRSTGGVASLVSLMDSLMADGEADENEDADATAETGESPDSNDSNES